MTYIIISYATYFLAYLSCSFGKIRTRISQGQIVRSRSLFLFPAALVGLIFICFAGFANKMADLTSFHFEFINIPQNFHLAMQTPINEIGWTAFVYFVKYYISNNEQVFLFIVAFISLSCVCYFLYTYSTLIELSIFIFVASGLYYFSMNGIRQVLAASLLLLATGLLLKKKYLYLIIICILLSFIHKSILSSIPLFFIVQLRPWSKLSIWVVTLLCVGIILIKLLLPFIVHLLYGDVSTSIIETYYATPGSNIIRVFLAAIPVVITFYLRKEIFARNDQLINISTNFSILFLLVTITAVPSGGNIVTRIGLYPQLFTLLLIPYVMTELIQPRYRTMTYQLFFVTYSALLLYLSYNGNVLYHSSYLGIR